jgi:phosphoribosylanthranilate isomerase
VTRCKICCIASEAEARLAIAHGAHAVGLVSEMPSGPGVIGLDRIAAIAATVPPGVSSFLLTSKVTAAQIIAQHRVARTSVLQLVDRVADGELRALREALPGVKLVPVIHVRGEDDVAEARAKASFADALLLDSGDPAAGELGGTGRVHDWKLSARIVREAGVPVFLAGGLTPDNVGDAIAAVRPYAVDVCSGLRPGGALDEGMLRAFLARVRVTA